MSNSQTFQEDESYRLSQIFRVELGGLLLENSKETELVDNGGYRPDYKNNEESKETKAALKEIGCQTSVVDLNKTDMNQTIKITYKSPRRMSSPNTASFFDAPVEEIIETGPRKLSKILNGGGLKEPLLVDASDNNDDKDDVDDDLLALEEDWSEDEEEDVKDMKIIAKIVVKSRGVFHAVFNQLTKITHGYLVPAFLGILFFIYLGIAMTYQFGNEASIRLLACTILGLVIILRHRILQVGKWLFVKVYGNSRLSPKDLVRFNKLRFFLRWLLYGALAGVILWVLIGIGMQKPKNLQSLPGIFIFLLIALWMSQIPNKINWHTVYWSVGVQFLSALMVLKWSFGHDAVIWIQDRLDEFFANSKAGSILMFGESFNDHYIIFGALPIIFMTNAALTALYYLGAMQIIIKVIGNSLNFVLETSPLESMGVAAGIFMEGVTALLALRPFLKRMTKSQLFLVITSIFSSLGGAYLAILSTIGISLQYLIPAMVVSAPATFAVCKLVIPEAKPPRKCDKNVSIGEEETSKYANLMDAMQTGALAMLPVIGDIVASAFTFVSFIAWINTTTTWLGDRVGVENLTIEVIASYLFYPMALFMGIPPVDCRAVGMLQGYRIFTANFVAFLKLTELKINKAKYMEYMALSNFTAPVERTRDDLILTNWNMTLKNGFLVHDRSEAILTYSLCGFSSFLAVAITLGIMISLVPNRKHWIGTITIPALICGNLANCMTGCFAGIFY